MGKRCVLLLHRLIDIKVNIYNSFDVGSERINDNHYQMKTKNGYLALGHFRRMPRVSCDITMASNDQGILG